MPASYVHQCVAQSVCDALSLFDTPSLRAAVLAGSEGPDPLFFSVIPTPGAPLVPKVGSLLHTRMTDDFLLALADACHSSELTRAYCCGFFSHYAADTIFHPFVYAHSLAEDGSYSSTAHCTLEHQIETMHFRRQGNPSGLPIQMAGFARLRSGEKDEIARALSAAIDRVFPGEHLGVFRVRRSFDDAVHLCSMLRSERGFKFRTLGAMLKPFGLDAPLHAHMMPANPPDADIMNDAHRPWASLWAPDQIRTDGFDELYAAAKARGEALVAAANGYMLGTVSYATLRALHGGFSYDSGLPWQTTCAAAKAPGTGKR
ncbi:MAG: zinc dependent phospholipase C family protein [Clostridia bacterium]|nr:zinc dependent phospholipase C family protein [Clostridia bacterium]